MYLDLLLFFSFSRFKTWKTQVITFGQISK